MTQRVLFTTLSYKWEAYSIFQAQEPKTTHPCDETAFKIKGIRCGEKINKFSLKNIFSC
jgi:hypothetical protein